MVCTPILLHRARRTGVRLCRGQLVMDVVLLLLQQGSSLLTPLVLAPTQQPRRSRHEAGTAAPAATGHGDRIGSLT
jgi:hypothetical protein